MNSKEIKKIGEAIIKNAKNIQNLAVVYDSKDDDGVYYLSSGNNERLMEMTLSLAGGIDAEISTAQEHECLSKVDIQPLDKQDLIQKIINLN